MLEEEDYTHYIQMQEKQLYNELHQDNKRKQEHKRLMSRSLWMRSGDKQTFFFHNQAKVRQLRNSIKEITSSSGDLIIDYEDIKREATSHFQMLLMEDEDHDS
jgi:hypothetical protein